MVRRLNSRGIVSPTGGSNGRCAWHPQRKLQKTPNAKKNLFIRFSRLSGIGRLLGSGLPCSFMSNRQTEEVSSLQPIYSKESVLPLYFYTFFHPELQRN